MKGSGFYYEFYNPTEVSAGVGCLNEAVKKLPSLGLHNAFFICDDIEKSSAVDLVRAAINSVKVRTGAVYVNSEKVVSLNSLREMRDVYRLNNCDCIVVAGNYRVINTAKTLRMLLSAQVVRFEDVKGINVARKKINVPLVVIPTSVGISSALTGSVSVKDDYGAVFGCVSSLCAPNYCIIDPSLTSVFDAPTTIAGAMESFAINIEEFVSKQAIIHTKCMNLIAIREIRDNLFKVVNDPMDEQAVLGLQKAGLIAGICYSCASAGIAHAMADALSNLTGRDNYICTGIVFEACLRYNLDAVEKDYAQALYYIIGDDRYASTPEEDLGRTLIDTSAKMIKDLFEENGLPTRLSQIGIDEESLDKAVEETMKSYAIVTNPKNVTKDDVYRILRSVM